MASRDADVGPADQLLQRLRADHGTARAPQGAAGRAFQPEGVPRPVPELRQCAGQDDFGTDAVTTVNFRLI